MDVTDEQRAVLSRELDRVLGTETTGIMMAHLPHGGTDRLATKQDMAELRTTFEAMERSVYARFGAMEQAIDARFGAMEQAIDARFGAMGQSFGAKFESLESKIDSQAHQLRAELRAELNASITGQTRAVIVSLIGTMVVLSGFMLVLIQTAQP